MVLSYKMEISIVSIVVLLLKLCVASLGQGTPHQSGQPVVQQPVEMRQGGNPNIIKVQMKDQDHILEHLDGVIDKPESEMTPEELQQHYFKLHDYDSNNMLDGNELIQAITHYHDEGEPNKAVMKEEEMMSLLDPIFQNEDRNRDGYIDYPEYARGQRA